MKYQFPHTAIPGQEPERSQYLRHYFCDKRACASLNGNQWLVTTSWPDEAEMYIDPQILDGLRWWSPDLSLSQIHEAVRDEPDAFQLSLNDSWTLYAWSRWLSGRSLSETSEVVILHVDYHSDLMVPRLGVVDAVTYTDLMTGRDVDMRSPDTVRAAILSGAIGIGSFMAPFLHAVPKVHLRHLCNGPLNTLRSSFNQLIKESEQDTLLAPGRQRPGVTFASKDEAVVSGESSISYRISDNLEALLTDLPDVPILLHVDMDYFNCRYDGDSDWDIHVNRYDPSASEIEERIEELIEGLCKSGIMPRVENIAVALSPGFFPVQFWDQSITALKRGILKSKRC